MDKHQSSNHLALLSGIMLSKTLQADAGLTLWSGMPYINVVRIVYLYVL